MFRLLRNATFLLILCGTLLVSTISLAFHAVMLGAQVTALTAGAAGSVLAQKKAVALARSQEKAKARLKRLLVAVPLVGVGAVAYFEHEDFREWQAENPDGTKADYACEVAQLSAGVIDDVLQDLPETIRPEREAVLSLLPDCAAPVDATGDKP